MGEVLKVLFLLTSSGEEALYILPKGTSLKGVWMDFFVGILAFTLVWAGPSALLSALFMVKFINYNITKGLLGSLFVTTGFIFTVIGVIKLSSKFHKDEIVPVLLVAYFILAGLGWSYLEYFRRRNITYVEILVRIVIPLLAGTIIGVMEGLLFVISPILLLFLWIITVEIPGIYWFIIRMLFKKAFGISIRSNIAFELLLLALGFIFRILISFLFFSSYSVLVLSLGPKDLLVISIIPYFVIGLGDIILNFSTKSKINMELTSKEKAILVFVPLYLSVALVSFIFLAWDIASYSGI